MSVVSGVTLICALSESDDEDGRDLLTWLQTYNDNRIHFREISDTYGGNKHPQHFVLAAGINYLDEDSFAAFVLRRSWRHPENVIVVIQPEDGATRIWRPPPCDSDRPAERALLAEE